MNNLIQELDLQEMQKTFGGVWIRTIVNGKLIPIWIPNPKKLEQTKLVTI